MSAYDIVFLVFTECLSKVDGFIGTVIFIAYERVSTNSELPLSAAPYFMALSALTDGLWSLICSFSVIFIYSKKGVLINGSSSCLSLNARTCSTSWLALFLNKSIALFPVYFCPINSSPPLFILPYFIFYKS